MLEGSLTEFRKCADRVNWKEYSNSDLFFKYIENEDKVEADDWLSGIIARYWGLGARIYTQCQKHIPFDECIDIIIDAAKYVLEKRVWENPNSSIHNDPAGPDKAMHIAIKRQKNIVLAKYSAYRRQSNFNTLSLDGFKESYNDAGEGWLVDIEAPETNNSVYTLVSSYFVKDDYLDGMMLDLICYSNSNKCDLRQIITELKNVDMHLYSYYKESYDAKENTFRKTLKDISETSNKLLTIKLKRLLYNLKKEMF